MAVSTIIPRYIERSVYPLLHSEIPLNAMGTVKAVVPLIVPLTSPLLITTPHTYAFPGLQCKRYT